MLQIICYFLTILLNELTFSRIKCIDMQDNGNTDSKKNINDDEHSVESMPLQSRLKEIGTVTRRSMRLLSGTLKPESDHKMVLLTRNINRAVSLPIERKSQMHDFSVDVKERGHSVQRDQVRFLCIDYCIL